MFGDKSRSVVFCLGILGGVVGLVAYLRLKQMLYLTAKCEKTTFLAIVLCNKLSRI